MQTTVGTELRFLLKHSSIYGVGTLIGQAVGFLLLPLYTRYLTPADYGVLSLVNITMDIIGIVVGLGIVAAMSRFYYEFDSEKERNLVVSTIYAICGLVTVIALPLLYLCSRPLSSLVFHTDRYSVHFLVASLALLFGMHVDTGLTYLRVRAFSKHYVLVSCAGMLLVIALNVYFIVVLGTGVIGIFYSSLLHKVVFSLLLGIPVLRKAGTGFSRSLASTMIRFSFPLIFSNIFRVIVNESDKYFINYFYSPFETGIYSIAQKIGNSLHALVLSPFLQTYMPRRFEIMKDPNSKRIYASVFMYYFVAICTVGLALSLFSSEIIRLMTTKDYYEASRYVPSVVLAMILFGLKYHFEIGIMIEKKTHYTAYITACAAIANVVLNLVLISRYKLWGALISVNCSYLLTSLLNYVVSQRLYRIRYQFHKAALLFLVVVSVYAFSLLVPQRHMLVSIPLKTCLLLVYLWLILRLHLVEKDALKPVIDSLLQNAAKLVPKNVSLFGGNR